MAPAQFHRSAGFWSPLAVTPWIWLLALIPSPNSCRSTRMGMYRFKVYERSLLRVKDNTAIVRFELRLIRLHG